MPKLYLHVGLPKTATTSVQQFLLRNRQRLLEDGVLYPKSGLQANAHHSLGNLFNYSSADWIETIDANELSRALREEVASSGCQTVIMSTETLAWAYKLEDLKEYFRGFDTSIVFYLRRQDEWLESAYQDNLKTGDTDLDKDAYLNLRLPLLDFYAALSRWSALFGRENIRVATFEKGTGDKSVERIFLDTLGISFRPEYEISKAINTGLSRDCIDFLSKFSAKRRVALRFWVYGDILRAYAEKNPDPVEWKNFWSPQERRELIERFSESNAQVAREFCGREDGILFQSSSPSDLEPWEPYPGLTAQRAVEIGEFLADRLFEQTQR